MRVRRLSAILGSVGILLVALAVVLRFVIVPIATRLPGDTDLTVDYEGTATLLDSEALQAGDAAAALRTDVPITVERRLRALSTDGDTAVLSDSLAVSAPDAQLPANEYVYAVDRSTLRGVPGPEGTEVEPADGALTAAFPIDPAKDDRYTYYDPVTRAVVPVVYTRSDSRGGRDVNVYTMSAAGPVKNPGLLAALPPALPMDLVAGLAPLLPSDVVAKFTPQALASLTDPVPLTYTGSTELVVYIDEQTGVAVDQSIRQQVVAHTSLGGEDVALLPVMELDFHITPADVEELADTAASAGLLLTLVGLVAPLVLLVAGLALIVVAVLRRTPKAAAGTDPGEADPDETGAGGGATPGEPSASAGTSSEPVASVDPSAAVPAEHSPRASAPVDRT